MKEYLKSVEEVLKDTNSTQNGITSSQAKERLEKNGANKLKEPPRDGLLKKFIKSLMDPMIIMLLAAAAVSAVTAIASNDSFTDVFIILFVVIVNTILGLVQESKAENAIDSLMEMTKATSKVIRDGAVQNIKSEDLVVGDVIVLEAGDAVPADCRILESFSMKVEEAALTGESVPVTKIVDLINLKENTIEVPIGDRTNMLYSGSTISYGRGKAVVVATGMDTEMGKIADALQQADDEKTPLQKKMGEISKVLTKVVIGISVFVFLFGIIKSGDFTGQHILDTFLIAVALAVAAIPEGLPAVVTIILSIGVTSMSKRQALVRKLNAVETLGCTQVICTDKTGTLTQNKMTVVEINSHNEKLLAETNDLILKIKQLYIELDRNKIRDKIYNEINENSTVLDALKLASSYYTYVYYCIQDNIKDITEEEIEQLIKELREFVNWPYYTILDNITMLNEKDVLVIIKDRYQLLKINITKEDLEQDNLDTAIVALEKIKMNENLLKNNINIDELESECEFGKILKSKI